MSHVKVRSVYLGFVPSVPYVPLQRLPFFTLLGNISVHNVYCG